MKGSSNLKVRIRFYKGVLEIKRITFLGATLFITGTLLFGIVHLAIANYIPNMHGWSDPPGKFQKARNEIGVNVPYILSIFFMILGFILLILNEV